MGPNAALAASGVNYVAISLVTFTDGVETGAGYDEGYTTQARSLVQGTPVLFPTLGKMDVLVKRDVTLYVKVEIVGTATLSAGAQLDGRRSRHGQQDAR